MPPSFSKDPLIVFAQIGDLFDVDDLKNSGAKVNATKKPSLILISSSVVEHTPHDREIVGSNRVEWWTFKSLCILEWYLKEVQND